jgi:hypothetical protein
LKNTLINNTVRWCNTQEEEGDQDKNKGRKCHAERKQEENVDGEAWFLDNLHKTGKITGRRKVPTTYGLGSCSWYSDPLHATQPGD